MQNMGEPERDRLKQDTIETLLRFDEVSRAISGAAIGIVGNLNIEEEKLAKEFLDKQTLHNKLLQEFSDTEQSLNRLLLDEKAKPRKREELYKKLKELRSKRISVIEEIGEMQTKLESIRVFKEGGGQIHDLLHTNFDALLGKLKRIKMLFPEIYDDAERDIELVLGFKKEIPK
nr:hypothetical protein [Candidatus Sigynarchaeota archaeon]